MDFQHITVTEVLTIEDVELYQTHDHESVLMTRGCLSVLYAEAYHWFILKINDFNYGLSKDIPILASSKEQGAVRAYVLINSDSYFVIKIPRVFSQDVLDRLDNILRENSQFAYKEGADGDGLPITLDDGIVKVKPVTLQEGEETKEGDRDAAHLIYNGGKAARKMIINGAEVLSVGISKLGNFVQTNYLTKEEEKPIEPKTASRLAMLNSATGMVNSQSTDYIKGLMSLSRSIAQRIETKFEKKRVEKEREEAQAREKREMERHTKSVTHAAVYTALSVWHGMMEALEIIRQGISNTATNMVTHKYGPAAGEVFRAGIGIAGSVSLPGSKFIKISQGMNQLSQLGALKRSS